MLYHKFLVFILPLFPLIEFFLVELMRSVCSIYYKFNKYSNIEKSKKRKVENDIYKSIVSYTNILYLSVIILIKFISLNGSFDSISLQIFFSKEILIESLIVIMLMPFLPTLHLLNGVFVKAAALVYYKLRGFNSSEAKKKSDEICLLYGTTCLKYYHDWEIVGSYKIPNNGGALLIPFHGRLPFDAPLISAHTYFNKNRLLKAVVEKNLVKFLKNFDVFNLIESLGVLSDSSLNNVTELLRNDELVLIYPGGVREAVLSENYELMWNNRKGFAKAAIQAKVPIYPIFTKNSSQIFGRIPLFKKLYSKFYEKTHILYYPFFCWFPVKLITYIGDPIEYDESRSVDELVELTQTKIKEMIQKYQGNQTSVFAALADRFRQ